MQVDRLRLVGFKSFVDTTELAIEPGLTGIVGPNGCGKSNLVEALRWVMGENSARRLRGGEMDDVIFGGTAGRPARNLAEVALTLDNAVRDAPFAFNDRETIEVTRRIERGSGSAYRINGQEVRARDVQLLFADAASGSNSAAMVSQGRIGALIAAKPAERRALLDEAAGTAGLHARRHEAELKLRGAEDNLLRLDDIIATMASQLDGLKKQARQAQRYRRLAEQIRQIEAILLLARWRAAGAESERVAAALRSAERDDAAAVERGIAAERSRAAAEAAVPPLRLAEAENAAAVQRLSHAGATLDDELDRVVAAHDDGTRRLAQLDGDRRREAAQAADAAAALAKLTAEANALAASAGAATTVRITATAEATAARAALAAAEAALREATEAGAADAARRASLDRQCRDLADRVARLRDRLAQAERDRAQAAAALIPHEISAAAAVAVATAERDAEQHRAAAGAAAQTAAARREAETAASDDARDSERRVARAKAEAEALAAVLATTTSSDGIDGDAPLLAAVQVTPGFEAAIGALFDDTLAAPQLDDGAMPAAAQGWRALPPLAAAPELPTGAQPLAEIVAAPAVLDRRLGQTGWVDSAALGTQLQARLHPGQTLVDREGRLWRWDGFTRTAAATGGATQHLRHRNRLAALTAELADLAPALAAAEHRAAAARAARQQAIEAERAIQQALRESEAALARTRAAEAESARRALAAEARCAALADSREKIAGDLADATAQAEWAGQALAALPAPAEAQARRAVAESAARAARECDGTARGTIERLDRDDTARRQRRSAIADELRAWQQRCDGASAQGAVLTERHQALTAELAALAARPAAIAAECEALAAALAAATNRHHAAGDALAAGEARLRAAGEAARAAAHDAAETRERRTRLEVQRDTAAAAVARLRHEIGERLDIAPEHLAALAGGDDASDPAAAAARLERLQREREAIGPVNLVAESEAAEVETRVAGLRRERGELTEAIARLRRGIAALDHEGRKRLAAAFEQLNGHFATLFARLFGGGEARLALTDDGDPLAAGLEIIASPPGKRRQALSLLSGGEQALAALALMLAVFMTNPAPVCVLDEVDAPLDDANVDRFCSLVAETADTTGTRFLLITHHRVTMARMDRLYGVTMRERGISQLVSVDLGHAARLRRSA